MMSPAVSASSGRPHVLGVTNLLFFRDGALIGSSFVAKGFELFPMPFPKPRGASASLTRNAFCPSARSVFRSLLRPRSTERRRQRAMACSASGRRWSPPVRPFLGRSTAAALKAAYGCWTNGRRTVRNEPSRLIVAPGSAGATQGKLFDYESGPLEARKQAAAHPDAVQALHTQIGRGPQIAAGASKSGKARKAAVSKLTP